MIEVQEATKRFASTTAVDGVSFRAEPGAIFGLLGPNGAGKTTIIRMIMNILAPDSGQVLLNGRALREEDKNIIGYLPEERGLYARQTVNEVLLYLAGLKDSPRDVAQPSIDRWLARLDLTEWRDRKVDELSKGMAQKVQFIAAVAHDPSVVCFDEPFSGVDPVSTELLREAMLEIAAAGKTVLFSTHLMDQAERMCHQILLIDQGREVIAGGLDDVKAQYGTNTIQVEFDGDIGDLRRSPLVSSVVQYPRWVEIEPAEGTGTAEILRVLAGRVSIRRFEVVSPSLHQIFVREVGGTREQEAPHA